MRDGTAGCLPLGGSRYQKQRLLSAVVRSVNKGMCRLLYCGLSPQLPR